MYSVSKLPAPLSASTGSATSASTAASAAAPRVCLLDLWATVPYYTAYLAGALQHAGASVQVASMTYYLDPDCFVSRGVQTDPGVLDVVGRLRLPRLLRRVLKFGEGLVNLLGLTVRFLFRPPDVLHVQFLPMLRSRLPVDYWFVRLCQRRGIPVVLTVHDLLPHDTGEHYRALYGQLYGQVDALICHSIHIQTRLQKEFGVTEEKLAVIPHGPFFFDLSGDASDETRAELQVAPGQHVVLWQGILLPYKGIDLLLQAWVKVERLPVDLCLVILGTGDPALIADLQAQARRLGLRNVRFHPRFCTAAQLVSAYRLAEVVVYPYRAITTSGALATGLALGKAIVASRLPVFEELLTDGEDAFLVDPEDATEMANAILEIVRNPELRASLEASVKKMRFGEQMWHTIAQDTLKLYAHVQQHEAEISRALRPSN